MTEQQKLDVVLREIAALASYYRSDWSGFDGRQLAREIRELISWAEGPCETDFDQFTKLKEEL